ncbi:hypothetical protein I552_5175 [Mycobacterium xenopi 3993]|nr:hypothetical protein I552_5175 [Mycobacterium xenopi 3993]
MADVDDVPDVGGVGRGLRVRFRPALVTGPAGELGEGLPPMASVLHGTSGGAKNSVLAINCTRNGAVSATALTLSSGFPHADGIWWARTGLRNRSRRPWGAKIRDTP